MNNQPHPSPYVGEYDPSLGRIRTHSDDFYDHRKKVLNSIRHAMQQEKEQRNGRNKRTRSLT